MCGKFVFGLDPANTTDFFGICCHDLSKGIPKLVYLGKMQNQSYELTLQQFKDDLFKKYPPFFICSDYSNERTFSDILEKLYGSHKIEKLAYTIPVKQMLKDDGLAILKQGYTFPNPDNQDPIQKALLLELITQLQNEQMLITKSGKKTYDHPPGKHNDLAAAWELSIHGCQRFLLKTSKVQVSTRKWGPEINAAIESGVRNPSYVTNTETYYPTNTSYH